ncbi:MAG: hypothetical protein QHH24_02635 [Candidatus Bathyarchaeota archaeon]|nr:hypothetical protein [Candidatus Bathyarchaeota archaeon]
MRILRDLKGVSALVSIILILCSFTLGALASYLWVMANFYSMPENTTMLIIENATFPLYNATYFNVTVLNPSNSARDTNVTAIRLIDETLNKTVDVTSALPSLPFQLNIGARQTFMCKRNWGEFAGDSLRVEPVAANVSILGYRCTTAKVKLTATPTFNISSSVKYFDLKVENDPSSVINLTVTEILLFSETMNTTPALPSENMVPGGMNFYRCNKNWTNFMGQNVTIKVKTAQGYEATYKTETLPTVILEISDVKFTTTTTKGFNITVKSSEDSTANAMISKINLTLQGEAPIRLTGVVPFLNTIFSMVEANRSSTFICSWNWTQYRDRNVTIDVYTSGEIKASSGMVKTPSAFVWNVTDVKLDLDDMEHFSVNIKNFATSLADINVTRIQLNQTNVSMNWATLNPDEQKTVECTFNWSSFRGKNVTLTVFTKNGLNVSRLVSIPSVQLRILEDLFIFGDMKDLYNVTLPALLPYFNVTLSNSLNSLQNLTITRIVLEVNGTLYEVDYNRTIPVLGPRGYLLRKGETVTMICDSDWTRYLTQDVHALKVTVYTKEGFQQSKTWQR